MSWNVKYVVLILFTTVVSYLAGILLQRTESTRRRKSIAIGAALLCLAVLFIFKYFDFVIESIGSVAEIFAIPMHPVLLNLVLPVGISFYTFQTLSYVIDVYRGEAEAEYDFVTYATFVSFFPQLVAGPIERTGNLLPQIKAQHYFDEDKAIEGAKLMLWGYYKKLVIADNVAGYVDSVYGNLSNYKGFDIALVVFLFTVQIYCDFSGYSDIAIGTAKLLDIDLMKNFKSPYFSASIKEFWSRWHISLSTWFRDYVYIPLGGNRCSKLKHYFNLLVTFLVSGLWHGASWNFVIWGGIHGVAQIIEMVSGKVLKKFRDNRVGHILCVAVVFIFCNLAWVFFRAENFMDAIYVISNILNGILNPASYLSSKLMSIPQFLLLMCYIAVLAIYDFENYKLGVTEYLNNKPTLVRWVCYVFIGLLVVFGSQKGVAAEFVYFQF
jgi:D-alanyl-lipoteichoic acid acyltransferase DltB (MBOAT superfamily)